MFPSPSRTVATSGHTSQNNDFAWCCVEEGTAGMKGSRTMTGMWCANSGQSLLSFISLKQKRTAAPRKGGRGKPHHPKEVTGTAPHPKEEKEGSTTKKGEENFSLHLLLLLVVLPPSTIFGWCCLPLSSLGGAPFSFFLNEMK